MRGKKLNNGDVKINTIQIFFPQKVLILVKQRYRITLQK